MFALVGRLPQPLKALYWAFLVVFAAAVVAFFLGDRAAAITTGLLGVVAVLIGLSIVTNVNGGAEALAEAAKSYRPLGIDKSGSLLVSPRFTRLFGLLVLVVGLAFITAAAIRL